MDENQIARKLLQMLQQNPNLDLGEAIIRSGVNIDRSRITQFRHYRGEEAQNAALKLLVPAMVETLDFTAPALIEIISRKVSFVSVLYYVPSEEPPSDPEEYCSGCTTWHRVGNTCVASCDNSEPQNSYSQHSSLQHCLAAPEPSWPDDEVAYPTLYCHCENAVWMPNICGGGGAEKRYLHVEENHPFAPQVYSWANAYGNNVPLIPSRLYSYNGGPRYNLPPVGSGYKLIPNPGAEPVRQGAWDRVTSNGWLVRLWQAGIYEQGVPGYPTTTGKYHFDIAGYSAYKECRGVETPRSRVYSVYDISLEYPNDGFDWQKIFSLADEPCSPYNDIPRGQAPQPRPPRRGKYKEVYLAGSRQPKFIKKIHESEYFRHYLTRTGDSDIIALVIGRSAENLCKVFYAKLEGENLSSTLNSNPQIPDKFPKDWRHPLISYASTIPDTPNNYLNTHKNSPFTNVEAVNGNTDLDVDNNPHYETRVDINLLSKIVIDEEPKYDSFLELFKLNKPIQGLVCFNPVNQPGKGFVVTNIIPADNPDATILGVSAYLDTSKLTSSYNSSGLTCSPPFIKKTEVLECWGGSGSGGGITCVSRGFVNYVSLSGEGTSTLVTTDCDGNITNMSAEYGGYFKIKTPIVEEIIGMCGDGQT